VGTSLIPTPPLAGGGGKSPSGRTEGPLQELPKTRWEFQRTVRWMESFYAPKGGGGQSPSYPISGVTFLHVFYSLQSPPPNESQGRKRERPEGTGMAVKGKAPKAPNTQRTFVKKRPGRDTRRTAAGSKPWVTRGGLAQQAGEVSTHRNPTPIRTGAPPLRSVPLTNRFITDEIEPGPPTVSSLEILGEPLEGSGPGPPSVGVRLATPGFGI